MSERLVVDSFMTADGEVVQLPTLGPLGPVDAERSEYRDWRVPDGASVSADDFSTVVDCAECGCQLAFGESYTSRLIHNDLGFGYAVCPRCYEAEFREMGESCDL